MTDHTFDAPAADEPAKRRNLVIAGGAAGLLVLGGAGFLLLNGGSSGSVPSVATAMPKAPHVVKNASSPKKATAAAVKLPAATTVQVGRDPFLALYVAPAAGTSSPSGGTGTSTSGSTGTGTGAGATTTGTAAPATTARYVLVLKTVTRDPGGAYLFNFTVDGTPKTVLPAQRFGKYGELVVLTYVKNSKGAATGAVVQVGDDSPIQVPLGVKVSVL
jgi:hypothetical protein